MKPLITSVTLLSDLKDIGHLAAFKKAIKKWSREKCPCRLGKLYISNVSFI